MLSASRSPSVSLSGIPVRFAGLTNLVNLEPRYRKAFFGFKPEY